MTHRTSHGPRSAKQKVQRFIFVDTKWMVPDIQKVVYDIGF